MREIKFRVWDMEEKKMLTWPDFREEILDAIPIDAGDEWTERCVLMQFTGLHDKNGKEIWEGDIVSFKQFGGYSIISSIRWNELSAMFDAEEGKIYLGYGMDCEVLGNIYEHPYLLKES